jgi:hypothetical protein
MDELGKLKDTISRALNEYESSFQALSRDPATETLKLTETLSYHSLKLQNQFELLCTLSGLTKDPRTGVADTIITIKESITKIRETCEELEKQYPKAPALTFDDEISQQNDELVTENKIIYDDDNMKALIKDVFNENIFNMNERLFTRLVVADGLHGVARMIWSILWHNDFFKEFPTIDKSLVKKICKYLLNDSMKRWMIPLTWDYYKDLANDKKAAKIEGLKHRVNDFEMTEKNVHSVYLLFRHHPHEVSLEHLKKLFSELIEIGNIIVSYNNKSK